MKELIFQFSCSARACDLQLYLKLTNLWVLFKDFAELLQSLSLYSKNFDTPILKELRGIPSVEKIYKILNRPFEQSLIFVFGIQKILCLQLTCIAQLTFVIYK